MDVDLATLALRVDALEVDAASKKLDTLTAAGGRAEKSASDMSGAFKALAGVLATIQIAQLAREAAMMAARYETLGATMRVVGNNAGYTGAQMDEHEKALRKTGIAAIEARETLTKMAAANISLSKSTELARIAQDAAVIGNINSSEAFNRMINGIRSGETEILKTIGINVNFEQSYKSMAAQLGKSKDALSETEKMTARVNAVLGAGPAIAGAYEAAMGTTGKMLNSLKRYADDLMVALGDVFGPSMQLIVGQLTEGLKGANQEVEAGKSTVQEWGKNFQSVVIAIEAEIIRLSMLIDKAGGTLSAFVVRTGQAYDAVKNLPQNMTNGIMNMLDPSGNVHDPIATTESSLTKLGQEWNKLYEDRYNAGDKALQALADLEVKLQNQTVKSSGAQEQARITAGKAARDQAEKEASLLAKQKDLAAAAKEHAKELQSLIDKYLPLRGAAETVAEVESGLSELRKKGTISATEYAAAIIKVREEYNKEVEAETHALELQTQLADAYGEVTLALKSKTEQEIFGIEDTYSKLYAKIDLLEQEKQITGEVAQVWRNNLGVKMAEDIQRVNDSGSQMGKMFEDVAKNIQSAFAGMFENMLDGSGNFFDSLLTLFRKLLAQMATMAIANPIIIPMVTGIGQSMGVSNSAIAKTLGVDQSSLSGFGGLGSMFSSGSMSGGLASMLGNWGSDLAFAGNTGIGSTMLDASSWLSNNPTMGSGLIGGGLSLAMSLLSGKGLTAQTGLQALGAGIGSMTPLGPVGGVIGGFLGNLVGGMFGNDEPPEFGIDAGILQNANTAYSRDTGFVNPSAFTYDPNFNETARTIHPIFSAYSAAIAKIQENFNTQLGELSKALPEMVRDKFLDNMATSDFAAILAGSSGGKWLVENAQQAIEGIGTRYAEGLNKAMGQAYGVAIQDYLSTNGAGGLVGSDAVWAMLTSATQGNITSAFTGAAGKMAGGDVSGGISTINSIQQAIAQIGQAMAPIDEIIASDGLSEYEQSLRAINQQFDQYAAALRAAGVDLSKYTALEQARQITLTKTMSAHYDELLAVAEKNLRDAFSHEQAALTKTNDDILAGLNAQLEEAQENVAKLTELSGRLRSALDSMRLGTDAYAMAQRREAFGTLGQALTAARGGNLDLAGTLLDERTMGALTASSEGLYATFEDYQRDYWKSYLSLAEISSITDEQLSAAEQAVSLLEEQLSLQEEWYAAEMAAMQSQLDAILGVNGSVLSLASAMASYAAAKAAASAATTTVGLASGTIVPGTTGAPSTPDAIESLYLTYLGRSSDSEGKAYWTNQYTSGAESMTSIINGFLNSEEYLNRLPSYDSGGYVPRDMTARIHQGEYVLKSGEGSEIVAELRQLRSEVSAMRAQAKKTADTLENWDFDGMPLERVV